MLIPKPMIYQYRIIIDRTVDRFNKHEMKGIFMNNSSKLTATDLPLLKTKELRNLKNSELDSHIKSLARQERELLTQVLHVIKEIDNRRLYLEMSYSSLFAYLTEAVGYSAASAQRRIDAARLLNEIPSLSAKIESGEIHLTQASMIQKAAREIKRTRQIKVSTDDKLELLTSLSGKNQRDTEKQVAQFFDMPVIQKSVEKTQADDSVRLEITLTKSQYEKLKQAQALVSHALPSNQIVDFIEYVCDRVIKQKTISATASSKKTSANLSQPSAPSVTAIHSEILSVATSPGEVSGKELANLQSELISTNLINSSAQITFLNQRNPTNQIKPTTLVNSAAQMYSSIHTKPNAQTDSSSLEKSSNHTESTNKGFPRKIKKSALSRLAVCQYRDSKTDKLCGSTWFLQVDHKHSQWAGGNNQIENATVLCSQHNNLKYRREVHLK